MPPHKRQLSRELVVIETPNVGAIAFMARNVFLTSHHGHVIEDEHPARAIGSKGPHLFDEQQPAMRRPRRSIVLKYASEVIGCVHKGEIKVLWGDLA